MSDVYLDSSAIGYRLRARRLMAVVVLVFVVFVGRLVQLQIIEGDDLAQASENNFIRTEVLPADRGAIFDRQLRPLAVNRPAFDLYVTPAQVKHQAALLEGLRDVLGLDELDLDRLREKLDQPRGIARYQPVRVRRDIDRESVARAEALRAQVDGISIRVEQQRAYPRGDVGAHLVGYLGRPRPEEVAAGDPMRFREGAMVGRAGLEQRYEDTLAGRNGLERFVVNARGARAADQRALGAVDDVVREQPVPGSDLVLTVDTEVQALLLQALSRFESGAIVAVDPRDGSVLGIVSKPTFDPNLWSGRLPPEVKQAVDENPYKPMIDKSVHSFFPGSVYKVVTALAALEENAIEADTEVDSPGSYEFGNRIFHCHKLSGHGHLDLSGALAASADVYFYKLGERLGIDTLATYATRFGFGLKTSLRINGESPGIVPTRAWHEEQTPGGYQFGLALSTAIGQGDVRTTPLQMALAYAALANGGTLYAPRIVDRVQSSDGKVLQKMAPQVIGTLGASPEHIAAIVAGLERTVADTEIGTGTLAAVPYGRVAGKTGTAQVRDIIRARFVDKVKDFRDRDHAWFAGFAPVESPRIVVVVFLEHGGTGGKEAAPVARAVLEGYHQRIEPIFNTAAVNDVRVPTRRRGVP
jgi:penicillin-binding protein 2